MVTIQTSALVIIHGMNERKGPRAAAHCNINVGARGRWRVATPVGVGGACVLVVYK